MVTPQNLSQKDHQNLKWNKQAEMHCAHRVPSRKAPSAISAAARERGRIGTLPKKVNLLQSRNMMAQNHRIQITPKKGPKFSKNSVVKHNEEDYESDSDTDSTDSSTSSESDVEVNPKCTNTYLDSTDSDGESDSSSSSSSDSSHSTTIPQPPPLTSMCVMCGQGPFRSMKLHRLHCLATRVTSRCFLCKKVFLTKESLEEHHMLLFSCDICGQVFSREASFKHHPCPKGSVSPLVLFCSEAMPKVCNICKLFFSSERMLFAHITRAHASVVKTKVCLISKPSLLSNQNILTGVATTHVNSPTSVSHAASQTIDGKLNVHNTSMYQKRKSSFSPSSLNTFPVTDIKSEDEPVRIDDLDVPLTPISHPSNCTPAALFKQHTDTLLAPEPNSTSPPSVPPLPDDNSHNKDLIERMSTKWRSKPTYPCRQCGAIFRQLSFTISHRYLHRGRRSHRCSCGQAFKHQLHLLRHCVQHAEAVNYICVSCGGTFTGAKLLAEHLNGKSTKKTHSGRIPGRKVMKKCKMPFTCECGQTFLRPSAYIWHQLRNRTKSW